MKLIFLLATILFCQKSENILFRYNAFDCNKNKVEVMNKICKDSIYKCSTFIVLLKCTTFVEYKEMKDYPTIKNNICK
jgi:hypothetical protein